MQVLGYVKLFMHRNQSTDLLIHSRCLLYFTFVLNCRLLTCLSVQSENVCSQPQDLYCCRYSANEIHFNLMAVVSDRKMSYEKRLSELQSQLDVRVNLKISQHIQKPVSFLKSTRKKFLHKNCLFHLFYLFVSLSHICCIILVLKL